MTKIYLKEETIQVVYLGYYHPSSANWNYHVHLVIDKTGARIYRSTFGGDSRITEIMEAQGLTIKKLSAGQGSSVEYKWRDISRCPDIEQYNGKNWGEGSLE